MNGDKFLFKDTVPNDGRGDTASFGEGGKSHVLCKVTVDVPVLLVLKWCAMHWGPLVKLIGHQSNILWRAHCTILAN